MTSERSTLDLAVAVHNWAESKPEIARLWFFGSRVKGTQRPDSDLDIAIELTSETVVRGQSVQTAWLMVCELWGGELDRLLGVETDLWRYGPDSPRVFTAVTEHGRLIVDKARGRH